MKMDQADRDRKMLEKFEVKRSRFYKRKKGKYYITEEPIVELTVHNGTDAAISRVYFKGTLASPNRSVPWLQDDINYGISGGLEPGETITWYLAPNMFSNWSTVKSPKWPGVIFSTFFLSIYPAHNYHLSSVFSHPSSPFNIACIY